MRASGTSLFANNGGPVNGFGLEYGYRCVPLGQGPSAEADDRIKGRARMPVNGFSGYRLSLQCETSSRDLCRIRSLTHRRGIYARPLDVND